jgi:ribonuclease J
MMTGEKLTYLPLGGAGEIGMNMYLYGYGPVGAQRFILVDAGLTFPNMENAPGVDVIMADPAFVADRADRLDGIFITHAHEDHVGALGHLHPRLRAPVYARRFTAMIARQKLERAGADPDVVREVRPWPETVRIGPFTVGFVPVAHSIPESSALVIDTPAGRILHTGDLKLDRTPQVGEPWDPDLFAAIGARDGGARGVKALVCDSTNVFRPNPGRSEADIVDAIAALMREAKGMVAATTFASNMARVRTLARAAHEAGRSVVLLGRAMNAMLQTAREAGVIPDFPPTVDPKDADGIPRERLFVMATGSQGERRAATAQLAQGSYLGMSLKEGDTFLFSSKTIPGNEISVGRIQNDLSEMGVRVVDDDSGTYHVSGHANRPDLAKVHRLVKPDFLVPMHGEHLHLSEHVRLGAEAGIRGIVVPNGAILDLTGDVPAIVDHVQTGRIYLDGTVLIGAMDGVVRDRIRAALRGVVVAAVVLEDRGGLTESPWVETVGLPDPGGEAGALARAIEDEIEDALSRADRNTLGSDEAVEALVERAAKTAAVAAIGKKPVVVVMISRLE